MGWADEKDDQDAIKRQVADARDRVNAVVAQTLVELGVPEKPVAGRDSTDDQLITQGIKSIAAKKLSLVLPADLDGRAQEQVNTPTPMEDQALLHVMGKKMGTTGEAAEPLLKSFKRSVDRALEGLSGPAVGKK